MLSDFEFFEQGTSLMCGVPVYRVEGFEVGLGKKEILLAEDLEPLGSSVGMELFAVLRRAGGEVYGGETAGLGLGDVEGRLDLVSRPPGLDGVGSDAEVGTEEAVAGETVRSEVVREGVVGRRRDRIRLFFLL